MKKVKFMQWECDVVKCHYKDGSIALELTHPEDGPIATATVFLEDLQLKDGYVWIKTWSENEGIYEALLEADVIGKSITDYPVNGWGSVALMVKVLI